jgi:pyrroline-5-carboxylate reductase
MKKTIAFIGVGNMGSAILNGMLQSQSFSAEDIIVFDTDEHKCHPFTEMGCCYASDTVSAVSKADVVLLAVKPQLIDSVMAGFAASTSGKLIISIAAGVTIDRIAAALPGAKVIRVMPNTPLQVGEGVSALCRGENVTDEEYALACRIFSCSGMIFETTESLLNPITALTSSSIAYFARFIGDMCAWGKKNGFEDPDALLELVCRSAIGTAEMLMQTEFAPDTLEAAVTSPRGTTERAMAVFTERDLSNIVSDAMDACRKRADELSGN